MAKAFTPQGAKAVEMRWMFDLDREYANGFKLAGDILVDSLTEQLVLSRQELLVPVAFNYRHYLELQMKHVLLCGKHLRLIPRVPFGHELAKLWTETRKLLENKFCGAKNELNAAEAVMLDFDKADDIGEDFRFPMRSDKQASLQKLPAFVSLSAMKASIATVHEHLDGYAQVLEHELDPPSD